MDQIAIFSNDAARARTLLQPLTGAHPQAHWIVVACPPRLTRHIGRWVTRSAQGLWRERWAAELYAELDPLLVQAGAPRVDSVLAKHAPGEVLKELQQRHPALRVLDARRPRAGTGDALLTGGLPGADAPQATHPVALLSGLAAMLALAE